MRKRVLARATNLGYAIAGDNTMNCAKVWLAPRRDCAVVVCVNQSGDAAFRASDEAVGALVGLHAAGTGHAESAKRQEK